jgi:SAM-dependent methyltransferase
VAAYGHLLHALVRQRERRQYFGTFFLRNRPELELIRRLADRSGGQDPVRMAVLGCSIGTEVYSIMWAIRSTRPDANLAMQAVDISSEALAVARGGAYFRGVDELAEEPVCQLMSDDEIREMFDAEGARLKVKPWIKEGIRWRVGDAGDPRIVDTLGLQDVVVANRFLCHMEPEHAERCLRNLARLVDRGGYLFVSGIDLDVRTKVADDLGWKPVRHLMEDIHDGDRTLRQSWPCRYWGLEPLDRGRRDWQVRYTSVFQIR